MHIETISGLHSCKPGNDPVVGQIKTFVIEHRKGKSGKPYIKIRSANAENGGTPHRILNAEKTDFVDQHGNISFNIEVEASSSPPSTVQNLRATMQQGEHPDDRIIRDQPVNAPQSPVHAQQGDWPPDDRYDTPESTAAFAKAQNHDSGPMSKDDYWRRKEDRDEARQRFIIRQHSQSMALEVLKLKVTLNELTVEDLTPAKLRALADYFDQDVIGAIQ